MGQRKMPRERNVNIRGGGSKVQGPNWARLLGAAAIVRTTETGPVSQG